MENAFREIAQYQTYGPSPKFISYQVWSVDYLPWWRDFGSKPST